MIIEELGKDQMSIINRHVQLKAEQKS
jgi:hypothetical protein